jgi:hypothetical protein
MKAQLLILGLVFSIVSIAVIAGCKPSLIGGDKDDHGCLIAAGYSWCEAKQKCLRTWEENCSSGNLVGNDKDEHGCIPSAGYSWCEARQECIRPWETNCTKECGTCPQLSPPGPNFCTDGTIVAGEKNECGCQGPPKCVKACTEEAKICPDGSAVGRNGSNNCEFDLCPGQILIDNGGIGINMTNPASAFCIAQGGESKIVTASDGSQSGTCTLPGGVVCDEWKYFRGECPASVNCTAAQKAAEACTLEYMPVCGDDGVTYGNKCSACASKNIDSYKPGECPEKTYVTRDPEQCKVIRYLCVQGKVPFSDAYGCGCETEKNQSLCGNGVCDPGEGTQCPACYYSTPPCLAPCTVGTCPDDCSETGGKLKANDCTEPRTQACTKEYMPVCGWRDVTLECTNPPCKYTYGNKCMACADERVAYWTEGACAAN